MLTLPFRDDDGSPPTDAELRVAKAQLVGWLEGLFHGIQATLFAQQVAARQQLEQIRQLPGGSGPGQPGMPGMPGQPGQPGMMPGQQPPSDDRSGPISLTLQARRPLRFASRGERSASDEPHAARSEKRSWTTSPPLVQ
ncbi:MAG: proteasome activator [Ilumatobacteraceae bacterium]